MSKNLIVFFLVVAGMCSAQSPESKGERWILHAPGEWWFYSAHVSEKPCGKVLKAKHAYLSLDGDDVLIEVESSDSHLHPFGWAKIWAENSKQCREERLNRCPQRICDQ